MTTPRRRGTVKDTDNLYQRVETGRILAPAILAGEILNFETTAEGTLRGVVGPAPLIPSYGEGSLPTYGVIKGICHALLKQGTREVLLVHDGDRIRSFAGWVRNWELLIDGPGSGAKMEVDLPDQEELAPPTQFIVTPDYIIIIPQFYQRAFIYDGDRISYLGYTSAPSAPIAQGPTQSSNTISASLFGSDEGFNIDYSLVHSDFGMGRLGTIGTTTIEGGAQDRVLLPGAYVYGVQHVAWTGDLSPVSGRSNLITWVRTATNTGVGLAVFAEARRKFAHLSGVSIGPDGTVGRNALRSKDTINSGDNSLYILPNSLGDAPSGTIATIPDNVATEFPDNLPDSYLALKPLDVLPFPEVSLGAMAFSRAWYAGGRNNGNRLYGSYPQLFGTIDPTQTKIPDATATVTALWGVSGGLLIFTRKSISMLVPGDQDGTFKVLPIHPKVGCIAPNSIASLTSGGLIWLGLEGFYTIEGSFSPGSIQRVSEPIQDTIKQINWAAAVRACAEIDPNTGEYRCWVPLNSSRRNNRCLVYRELYQSAEMDKPPIPGWAKRRGENIQAVAVTADHRKWMIAGGRVSDIQGVWVLDREIREFAAPTRAYVVETVWIGTTEGPQKRAGLTVYFYFREWNFDSTATVTVYINGRKTPAQGPETIKPSVDPNDIPARWGQSTYGSSSGTWVDRKVYWVKVDIWTGGIEYFKIRLESSSPFEYTGMKVDEQVREGSGRTPTPRT